MVCNIAHCGETVHVHGRLPFYTVLGSHIELIGHLNTIVSKQILIQRLAIAGYAATDAGGMGGEDCGYLWHMLAHIESAQTSHPLVDVIHHTLVLTLEEELPEAFHDQSGSISKHAGLVIVAISMQTIHLEIRPGLSIQFVLFLKIGLKIHQDHFGLSWNIPASRTYLYALAGHYVYPIRPNAIILSEEWIFLATPQVGTDKK